MNRTKLMKTTDMKNPQKAEEVSTLPLIRHIEIIRPRAGDICPHCKNERLDYDGLLNLVCPKCGVASTGCFT